jgi:hypothetical protein
MYPNPTTLLLNINKPDAIEVSSMRIFNALGQLVLLSEWKNTIDVSSLSTGVFMIQFQTNKGVITKSLLKN